MTTPEEAALLPLTENWHVERHDHDDGVISYEIWGYLRGEYSFLFHIYEQPFVDEAQRIADLVVNAVNGYLASTAREAKLREALENIEDIATTGRISELVEKFNTMKLIAREALADKETP